MKTQAKKVPLPPPIQRQRRAWLALLTGVVLAAAPARAYEVNKDLRNLGPAAQDLHVLLSGPEQVTSHFDGYSPGIDTGMPGRFHQFNSGPEGPNTQLTWREFSDGQDNTIDPGQTIHVGWSTADGHCQIIDMWWTDGTGQRIPGSVVYNITSKTTYETAIGAARVEWQNVFTPRGLPAMPINIAATHFVVLSNAVPLDALNAANQELLQSFRPLPGGENFTVAPGQTMDLMVPGVMPGDFVVLRYKVFGPGGSAETTDFVQAQAGQASLPVFRALGAGVTPAQATTLALALGIPPDLIELSNGVASYVDPKLYAAAPMQTVGDQEVFDFPALQTWLPLPDSEAQMRTFNAFAQAGLLPLDAEPRNAFAALTLTYADPNSGEAYDFADLRLDTQVDYSFALAGRPLVGPGARVQVAFHPGGLPTHLLYSARTMQPFQTVTLPPIEEAISRAAQLYPGIENPMLDLRLVYYAPPWPLGLSAYIVPTYDVGGTAEIGGQRVTLNRRFLPATTDAAFVPRVNLIAITTASGQVAAQATVAGGQPPYTFNWAASEPDLDTNTTASVLYTPLYPVDPPTLLIQRSGPSAVELAWRAETPEATLEATASLTQPVWIPIPNPPIIGDDLRRVQVPMTEQTMFFRLRFGPQPVQETVVLVVTDANGVQVQAVQTLAALAVPRIRTVPEGQLRPGRTDYGIESPFDAGLGSTDRRDFQIGMSRPFMGGGTQQFCWLDRLAWERDFKEPPRWLRGLDFLYADNVDLCFYVGHGWPNGFTFVNPLTDDLWLVNTDVARFGGWSGAWGDVDLEWMTLLSCQVLQGNWGNPAQNVFARWLPSFDGLHLLCGFDTLAWARTGFPRQFGDNLLGWPPPRCPMPVRAAWLAASVARQPRGTTAAVMGVVGPRGQNNFNDYYWGKGPVGPTLKPPFWGAWWMAVRTP